jgi:K+-dependent Na+/Ca+ exchanger-like protein
LLGHFFCEAGCVTLIRILVVNNSKLQYNEYYMIIILYIIGILLTFYALYIVVDKFLIPTIYIIKDKIGLTDDQTGALTSFVSSAPELSVSMISLYLAIKSGNQQQFQEIAALGPASVIGSALFSVLFIVGASAWFGGKQLTWHSITRDMGYYIFAVVALYLCLFDGKVEWYEGVILLALYMVYALLVAKWPSISKWLKIPTSNLVSQDTIDSEEGLIHIRDEQYSLSNFVAKITSYIFFPLKDGFKGGQVVYNVFMAVFLVIVSSTFMVEYATKLAQLLNIPAALIGVTILAAGTSVPDLLASVKTAKEGYADTAITNAIGSNVFDVLGNLGLTYVVAAIFTGGKAISVDVASLQSSIVLLAASSCVLLAVFFAKKFNLSKAISIVLMLSYLAYLVFICYTTIYK